MARQTEKLSDKFKSGGNKHGEKEQLFFAEASRIDPEWAVLDLLRSQVDTITDVVNANDAGSGSFAAVTKNLTSASSSFSTRVALNDAKVSMVIGVKETQAKAGNTTTISTSQASAITANTAKKGISTSQASAITANTAKTGISDSQASAITANTAKTGTETDLAPSTDGGVLRATVEESRGVYTLTFIFTTSDGRTTKKAAITMS